MNIHITSLAKQNNEQKLELTGKDHGTLISIVSKQYKTKTKMTPESNTQS
jgi:hypothetical protein